MTDVFISYTREDRAVAARLAQELDKTPWNIFWDRQILAGAQWNEEIQREIKYARCVCVLWSKAAVESFWVRGEAVVACEREVYLPFSIDDCRPPRVFSHVQVTSLEPWVRGSDPQGLLPLIRAVESRIGTQRMYGNLEAVADDEPVETKHLHLVHSCWRVSKTSSFGPMPYQIHVVLVGHPSALDRVERVEYSLPGYPEEHRYQRGGPRERLFELKELANGFSIVQAEVRVRDQQKTLHLSRLVNMSESGPRLLEDFVSRSPFRSSLVDKLSGLPSAVTRATELLRSHPLEDVRQRLMAEGVPPYMADAAISRAAGRSE